MAFIKHTNTHKQFIPSNPKKYSGNWPIIYRSEWERMFMQWLDVNDFVIEWKSESNYINYFDPVLNKNRRYFPDFFVCLRDKDNNIKRYIIEVKPYKETIPPRFGKGDSQKTKAHKQATYITNKAKWKAATEYCKRMGYGWKILTERELFK